MGRASRIPASASAGDSVGDPKPVRAQPLPSRVVRGHRGGAGRHGSLTVDWPPLIEKAMKGIASDPGPGHSKPPASPTPAAPATAYLGTYANGYFGPLAVTPAGRHVPHAPRAQDVHAHAL